MLSCSSTEKATDAGQDTREAARYPQQQSAQDLALEDLVNDLRERLCDTISAVQELAEFCEPTSIRVYLQPKSAVAVEDTMHRDRLTALKAVARKKGTLEQRELFEDSTRGATHLVMSSHLDFDKGKSTRSATPSMLKYFYADFCSFACFLLARYLRSRGRTVEVKSVRFVPNEAYVFPVFEHLGGLRALHECVPDEEVGNYVRHAVLMVDGKVMDMLAPVFGNAQYRGVETWTDLPHEHSGGTGVYHSYDAHCGWAENARSFIQSLEDFASDVSFVTYPPDLLVRICDIWGGVV